MYVTTEEIINSRGDKGRDTNGKEGKLFKYSLLYKILKTKLIEFLKG